MVARFRHEAERRIAVGLAVCDDMQYDGASREAEPLGGTPEGRRLPVDLKDFRTAIQKRFRWLRGEQRVRLCAGGITKLMVKRTIYACHEQQECSQNGR